jgi:hypothetical protein
LKTSENHKNLLEVTINFNQEEFEYSKKASLGKQKFGCLFSFLDL